jgi:pimeloyl-ACP methyl ester carboxylesterase/DNA-binding winged helix-turn-helix (wHTH) protein
MNDTPTLVFGPFRLDVQNATLERAGMPVALTPKAFSVLHHLARHAGRLVTKEEFLDVVWPGVFVGDAALKVCIREIRKAIGDDPATPTYIQTAHRRGYRFVAPVTLVTSPHADAPLVHGDESPVAGRSLGAIAAATAPPATRYARSGDVSIAYQVLGDGPIDLVFVMGWVSHLDYFWREPSFARFLTRLASFSRLILFDKRGTGLSDRVTDLPTLEQRMDDVRAVMEAVGSERAALMGVSEGGPLCSLFATTYPSRTLALVMIGTYAKRLWAPDYPWGPTRTERERFFDDIRTGWGGPVGIGVRAPSRAEDPAFREWWSTYLRMGASPGAALTLTQMNAEIDVRHVLPAIRVPTLVLHRTDDRCLKVEEGRYVADHIPGATFVELPGDDHLPFVGDQDAMLDAIEPFLTRLPHDDVSDRVLATILHTRVTARDGQTPDVDGFVAHARREIDWFRGRWLDRTADGLTAAFDGPARAIRCAASLAAAAPRYGLAARGGLHTGECADDGSRLEGPAVALAATLSDLAPAGEVLVSRTVKDLVAGAGLFFDDRGAHVLDADGQTWRVFAARALSATPAAAQGKASLA